MISSRKVHAPPKKECDCRVPRPRLNNGAICMCTGEIPEEKRINIVVRREPIKPPSSKRKKGSL